MVVGGGAREVEEQVHMWGSLSADENRIELGRMWEAVEAVEGELGIEEVGCQGGRWNCAGCAAVKRAGDVMTGKRRRR